MHNTNVYCFEYLEYHKYSTDLHHKSVKKMAAVTTENGDLVPTEQEAGWAPEPVWMSAENLTHTGNFFCSLYFICTLCTDCPGFAFCPYCATHTTQTSMPPAGFEPATPASNRL
jgi:hypothetical protein